MQSRWVRALGRAAGTAVLAAAVSTGSLSSTAPQLPQAAPILVGAGDIGYCESAGVAGTAALLDRLPGTVFTTGDNAYPSGSPAQFTNCYDPWWGRHRNRTRPSPGNHDYGTPGATGYFGYFGDAAGDPTRGYYSYDLGDWHVVVLNSNIAMDAASSQIQWLRDDLSANQTACTLAYWHHPLFSSGPHGNNAIGREAWRVLYEFKADVVLNGHDHDYERFAPQDPDGLADPTQGIREFVVGTGGAPLYSLASPAANSEIFSSSFGVLQLTLEATGYRWAFVPIEGETFYDSGTSNCVGIPPLVGVVDSGLHPLDLDGNGLGDSIRYDPVNGGASIDLEDGTALGSAILTPGSVEAWSPNWTIKAGDFNTDGRSDLFFYNDDTGDWYKGVSHMVNGTLQLSYYGGRWSPGWSIAVLDLDGDDRDDVFLYNPTTGVWFRATSVGDGTTGFDFTQGRWSPGWQVHPVELNGDDFRDLVLYNPVSGAWYRATNDGGDFAYVGGRWSPGWQITPFDHTGSGTSDLLFYSVESGQWYVGVNTGSDWAYHQGNWSPGWSVRAGDLDADGRTDLFVYNSSTGDWYECLSNGDGSFSYTGGTWATGWRVLISNFDSNGLADLLLYDHVTGVFNQAINRGAGSFTLQPGQWQPGRKILATHSAP